MKGLKKHWRWGFLGVILIMTAGGLQLAARKLPAFGTWYAERIYPVLVGSVGRVFGWLPFSLVEFGLYGLILCCLIFGILHIREGWWLFSRTLVLIGAAALVYTLNCGINYYRKPFSSYLDLDLKKSSEEELKSLCRFLTSQVNAKAEERAAGAGEFSAKAGVWAMEKLGGQYPQLSGFYPEPKAVACSRILSVQQLCGIYSPFTIEANYNQEMTPYNIPHTICHELSHLKGFMREDEANFIGFLACVGAEDPDWEYSGYLTGWVYAGNALYKVDSNAYWELHGQLAPSVQQDLRDNNVFWDRFDTKVAEAATKVNDSYLKANSQSDGVKSYGRMVDLMLAYYHRELAFN